MTRKQKRLQQDAFKALQLILGEYMPRNRDEALDSCFRLALVAMMGADCISDGVARIFPDGKDGAYSVSVLTILWNCSKLVTDEARKMEESSRSKGFAERFEAFIVKELGLDGDEIRAAAEAMAAEAMDQPLQ